MSLRVLTHSKMNPARGDGANADMLAAQRSNTVNVATSGAADYTQEERRAAAKALERNA